MCQLLYARTKHFDKAMRISLDIESVVQISNMFQCESHIQFLEDAILLTGEIENVEVTVKVGQYSLMDLQLADSNVILFSFHFSSCVIHVRVIDLLGRIFIQL